MLPALSALPSIEDVLVGTRFVWNVRRVLRRPLTIDDAQRILQHRLRHRETAFLTLAQRAVYAYPRSPYAQLLRLAGCEYGDLERLVRQEGPEGALLTLCQRGVYLTGDEFKGRKPVVRGSASMQIQPADLLNPLSAAHIHHQSSGSRGKPALVPLDLAYVRELAVNGLLTEHALGAIDWIQSTWAVPGGMALVQQVRCAARGVYPAHWFLQVDPGAPGLDLPYRLSTYALRLGSLLAGVRMPRPELVPVEAPLPIARWMVECLAAGKTASLNTFASPAARVCLAAAAAGLDLTGAHFFASGEPLTQALVSTIHGSGAGVTGVYWTSEAGLLAWSCLRPERPDDMHVMSDLHVLVQPGPRGKRTELSARTVLVTSLTRSAPLVLFNFSLGDEAELGERSCGCPLEHLGWSAHLHTVRSPEKLTAGGMTFRDTDVIQVLEEALPARFGGSPTDYQLVEEADADGITSLYLFVHPSIGPLDTGAVADTFLTLIGGESRAARVMELQWRGAQVLRVERRAPIATASGKILHLHQVRQQTPVASR